MKSRSPLLLLLLLTVVGCNSSVDIPENVQTSLEHLPDELDYNIHVKPILSDRCFKCHGPDKSKIEAGLQLATYEGATLKLESGEHAIVPGSISRSELVKRILSHDPEEVMPPMESHLTLSDEEKAVLIKWVEEGAGYKEHWSLQKIEKPEVPTIGASFWARVGLFDDEETKWVTNEIDHFVLRKMKEKNLKPSTQAEKATLLRRVSMDLTGLPPSVEEVESFLKDRSDNAYEKVVDQLLASPHFGEQQAVSWLDLARYADSHGYQDDGMRNAYPYRDWVIKAFNDNLSFDKFITYQLAGDLLDNPSKDMLVATSFNRQHPQTQEGGVVQQEYHSEYVADRTNTFGKAFLGLTMECARCHDHKYDPISAKDYYSLSAFFNQNKDWGEVPYDGEASPTVMLPDAEVEKKLQYIRENIKSAEEQLFNVEFYKNSFVAFQQSAPRYDTEILKKDLLVDLNFEKLEEDNFLNSAGSDLTPYLSGDKDRRPLVVNGKFGKAIQFQGDCGLQILTEKDRKAKKVSERFYQGLMLERNEPFSLSFWINVVKQGTSGPVITRNNGEFEGFRGYDIVLNKDATLSVRMMYVYPANGIEFITQEKVSINDWTHIALTYDGSSKASGLKLFINGKLAKVRLLTDNLTKSILHGTRRTNWSFMPFEIGKDFRSTIANLQFDELRFYQRKLSATEIEALTLNETKVKLDVSNDKLYEFYLWNYNEDFNKGLKALSKLRLEEVQVVTDVPEVMVMQELPDDQKRKTFILQRGAYDSHGEEVSAEVPVRLGRLREEYPRNRLGLSRWLLDQSNPLFGRVMVNRIWLQFFGNGLVKTQEDFGNQGDLPTHPELLDWLAIQFREDGWDLKKFVKRIVMSSTYRQSSVTDAQAIENDPDNKWLARGPRYQYAAEQVRDNALAASGLLVRKVGGPSVYPYQPSGIWEALATRNAVSYKQQHGDSLYRRSMYTIWKRSSPPPMMLNFDAPDRNLCTVRRQRTATPLQALVTMNDPQFMEAARVLAQRTLALTNQEEEVIRQFFLSIISREPRAEEKAIMIELINKQKAHYHKNPALAKDIVSVGEYPTNTSIDPVSLASYTVAANTIMNYDEAVFKR